MKFAPLITLILVASLATVSFGDGAVCFASSPVVEKLQNAEVLQQYRMGEVSFADVIEYAGTIGLKHVRSKGHVIFIEDRALPVYRQWIVVGLLEKLAASTDGTINLDLLDDPEREFIAAEFEGAPEYTGAIRSGEAILSFQALIEIRVSSSGESASFFNMLPLFPQDAQVGKSGAASADFDGRPWASDWNLQFIEIVSSTKPARAFWVYNNSIRDYIAEMETDVSDRLSAVTSDLQRIFESRIGNSRLSEVLSLEIGQQLSESVKSHLERGGLPMGAHETMTREEIARHLANGILEGGSIGFLLSVIPDRTIAQFPFSTQVNELAIPLRFGR